MSGLTDVQLINWALDLIPAEGINARTDISESARCANRNYDIVLTKCLRRATCPWNFATRRIQLTANNTTPVNEFDHEYDLPGDVLAIQKFWPQMMPYRKEGGKLYTSASTVIIKYTTNDILTKPYLMEYDFAEYFVSALAAQMATKLSEDPNRAMQLTKDAEVAFRHAASAFSMEDTPDQMPNGLWLDMHEGLNNGSLTSLNNLTDFTLDYGSLP